MNFGKLISSITKRLDEIGDGAIRFYDYKTFSCSITKKENGLLVKIIDKSPWFFSRQIEKFWFSITAISEDNYVILVSRFEHFAWYEKLEYSRVIPGNVTNEEFDETINRAFPFVPGRLLNKGLRAILMKLF